MRLDAFLTADALATPGDGKFYMHGGGLTRVMAPGLPFTVPQLGVFVRLELTPDEMRAGFKLQLALKDPYGNDALPFPELDAPAAEPPELLEGEPNFIILAVNIGGVAFVYEGLHRFELTVGDVFIGSSVLAVIVAGAPEVGGVPRL